MDRIIPCRRFAIDRLTDRSYAPQSQIQGQAQTQTQTQTQATVYLRDRSLIDLQTFLEDVGANNRLLSKKERELLQQLFAEWSENAQDPVVVPLIKGLSSLLKKG